MPLKFAVSGDGSEVRHLHSELLSCASRQYVRSRRGRVRLGYMYTQRQMRGSPLLTGEQYTLAQSYDLSLAHLLTTPAASRVTTIQVRAPRSQGWTN